MKVILLDNIRGVGMAGDIKEVNDGYARNFLLPRKLARLASAGAVQNISLLKKNKLTAIQVAKENAKKVSEFLKGTTITLSARTNEKGTLFDGIEAKDIARAMQEKHGISVPPEHIKLSQHIKHTGPHYVIIELDPKIKVEIVVEVKSKTQT